MSERTESLALEGLHCADCAKQVEDALRKMRGVHEARVLVGAGELQVRYDARLLNREALVHNLARLGQRVVHPQGAARPWWRRPDGASTTLAGAVLAGGLAVHALTANPLWGTWGPWALRAADLCYLLAVGLGAFPVARAAWGALRNRQLGINGLMTIAIVGAAAIGEFVEAASLAFLFGVAELLERHAVDRARRSLRELLALAPRQATVLHEGGERVVPVEAVRVGDTVLVRPGEQVPLDGTVLDGRSSVNQGPITGESIPIDKAAGDPVYAGSLNEEGVLRVRAVKAAAESTLARIIQLVGQAEAQKAPTERAMERFGRVYTPVVVGLAVLVGAVPPLLLAQPAIPWLLRAITLLVIACPCALLISTPVSVVSAITAAARQGVLIKGGVYLEALGQAKAIAFDKTGTLTTGQLEVQAVVPLSASDPDEVLRLAASLEANSRHPVGRAIVRAAAGLTLAPVTAFASLTGQGVEGVVGGRRIRVGKRGLFPDLPADALGGTNGEAKSTVVVGTASSVLGLIVLRDRVRPEAARTVAALRRLGLEVVMITGDRGDIAKSVAAALGIRDYRSSVLPEQKLEAVRQLGKKYGGVIMVGDGVNDAPALAAAQVGVAMGAAGTDTALETADVALLGDDLSKLPELIELSRRASRVIRQNVAVSLLAKAGLSAGVLPGWVDLIGAVLIGDMGTSLAVTGNAMRLSWQRRGGGGRE